MLVVGLSSVFIAAFEIKDTTEFTTKCKDYNGFDGVPGLHVLLSPVRVLGQKTQIDRTARFHTKNLLPIAIITTICDHHQDRSTLKKSPVDLIKRYRTDERARSTHRQGIFQDLLAFWNASEKTSEFWNTTWIAEAQMCWLEICCVFKKIVLRDLNFKCWWNLMTHGRLWILINDLQKKASAHCGPGKPLVVICVLPVHVFVRNTAGEGIM